VLRAMMMLKAKKRVLKEKDMMTSGDWMSQDEVVEMSR
jgi:hypothetical protein